MFLSASSSWGSACAVMNQVTIDEYLKTARFEGPVDAHIDFDRLCGQIRRIFDLMKDGFWRTLSEIEQETGDPQASVSAQLRHLRKTRFGGHIIEKRRRNNGGQWEYSLIVRRG